MKNHRLFNPETALIRAFVAIFFMDLIHKEEAYKIIGIAMEVHNNLGAGKLQRHDFATYVLRGFYRL